MAVERVFANALNVADAAARNIGKPGAQDIAELFLSHPEIYAPTIAKLPEDEDRSIISTVFGVPLGFQFGTALGMEGVPAFLVDVLSDPTTYLSGGLTALGRGGRAAAALSQAAAKAPARAAAGATRFDRQASRFLSSIKKVDHLQPDQAAALVMRSFDVMARTETDSLLRIRKTLKDNPGKESAAIALRALRDKNIDPRFVSKEVRERLGKDTPKGKGIFQFSKSPEKRNEFIEATLNSLRQGGLKGANEFVGTEIVKRTRARELALSAVLSGDSKKFLRAAKQIRKQLPSQRTDILFGRQALGDLKALFRQSKQGPVPPLARSDRLVRDAQGREILERDLPSTLRAQMDNRVGGMRGPQRTLLSLKMPFTDIETDLVPFGQKLMSTKAADKVVKTAQKAFGGRKSGLVPGAARSNAMRRAVAGGGFVANVGSKVNVAGPDSVHDAMMLVADAARSDRIPTDVADIRDMARIHRGHVDETRVKSVLAQDEFLAAVPDIKDRQLIWQMMDQPGEFLNRGGGAVSPGVPGTDLVHGSFGQSTIFGELTPAARRAGMTDKHQVMAESIDAAFRKVGDHALRDESLEQLVFNYAPRRISKILDETKFNAAINAIRKKNPLSTFRGHAQTRKFLLYSDLQKMEKAGILELEKDPAKILQGYFEEAGKAAANARFIEKARQARVSPSPADVKGAGGVIDDEEWLPVFGRLSNKKLRNTGKYETISDPDFSLFARKLGFGSDGAYLVHKDELKMIKAVIDPGLAPTKAVQQFSDKAFENAHRFNAVAKRSLLWGSLFHHTALTESAVATLGADFFKNPIAAIRSAQITKFGPAQRDLFEASDMITLATNSGLQMGPMVDAEVGALQRLIKASERSIPVAAPVIRQIGKLTGIWDKGLWDFYHSGLKLHAFQELYTRALVKFPKSDPRKVAQGTADHVNNAFGGQTWENLLISKTGLRWGRLAFLAPDWTLSNLRVASDVFADRFKKSEMGQKFGQLTGWRVTQDDLLRQDIRSTFARQYALRTGLIFGLMANMVNYAFTTFQGGGTFMEGNGEGDVAGTSKKSMIKMPWKDERGREQYARFGKQFREPFEWLAHPLRSVNRKLSVFGSTARTVVSGRNIFGEPIVTPEDGPVNRTFKTFLEVARTPVPISIQQAARAAQSGDEFSASDLGQILLGATGLPIKTEQINRRRQASAGSPPDIPEIFGDLADDPAFRAQLRQAQDGLPVIGGAIPLPVAQ